MSKYDEWRKTFDQFPGGTGSTTNHVRDLIQVDIAESLSIIASILADLRNAQALQVHYP